MNTVNMLADYTNHLSSQGMSAGTVKIYMGHLGRFGKWIEGTYGEFDPAATTALDVADYRRYLQNRNRKPATINNALNAISNFFMFARDTGLVDNDPSAGVKRVKEQKTAPKWLSRRDTGAFVRAVQKHGNKKEKALILLLLHTGLRVSEAVSLNVADIVIRERSGHVIVRRGKGDKYREVPLNVTIRNTLQNYISSLAGDVLFPGKLPEVQKCDSNVAWFIYGLNYNNSEQVYSLVKRKVVYTQLNTALQTISTPVPGKLKDFMGFLQEKLDEKLEKDNLPETENLADTFMFLNDKE